MRGFSTRVVGLLVVILGAWGGIVPFIGGYFHFAMGPTKTWTWTSGRLWLSVLPGVVAVLGGLMMMGSGPRGSARLGALLGLAAGAWFAVGPLISELWTAHGAQGAAHGSPHIRMLEMLAYHTGLGVIITGLSAYALPRFPAAAAADAGPRRRYDEPGAGDDMPRRPRTARAGGGEAAAVGAAGVAGAAGAAAAERPRRREVPAESAAAAPRADERRAERAPAAREPMGEQGVAGREPTAGAATGGQAAPAGREPIAAESTGEAQAAPAGREPVSAATASDGRAGESPTAATSANTPAASQPPAATRTVRRRRGGLLGVFSRR